VMLRAMFPNDDEKLYPNEFVNVKLLVDVMQNAVLVPTAAVQSGAPGDYVYFVNADDTVSVRKVTTGPSDGKNTAILAGLAQGDRVVTDGTDRLSDGAKIRVAQASFGQPSGKTLGKTPGNRGHAAGATSASSTHAHHHHGGGFNPAS
ncbi:MAG: rane fusion protein multidrug efflux system, partial [Paraburkholderia sp.]|nr:rane fusion protein multidrug efflux system [Paraburkholderia sp.]